MALVHHDTGSCTDRSICYLAVAVVVIIAAAVPCFQLAVNMLFGLFY